jgi:NfeD-like.
MLTEFLFVPHYWVIAGLILVALELTDGSLIFFLPLGLSSLLQAGIIYLQQTGMLGMIIYEDWWENLIGLAILMVLMTIMLRVVSHHRSGDGPKDVNDY